jgi:hypothetical protein
MSRQAIDIVGDEKSDKVEVQGSGVRGSGRAIFTLVNILFNLIDDELTVSDAHKCAGKKVDMVKRALRVGTGLVNKVSNAPELGEFDWEKFAAALAPFALIAA